MPNDIPQEKSAAGSSEIPGVFALAASWPVVRRAFIFAVIVGSVLVGINHCNCCLISNHVSQHCVLQVALTVCVPYVVSTVSSVLAIREAFASQHRS